MEQNVFKALLAVYNATIDKPLVINIKGLFEAENAVYAGNAATILARMELIRGNQTRPRAYQWIGGRPSIKMAQEFMTYAKEYINGYNRKNVTKSESVAKDITSRASVKVNNKVALPFRVGDVVHYYDASSYRIVEIDHTSQVVVGVRIGSTSTHKFSFNNAKQFLSFKPYSLMSGGFTQEREIDYNTYVGKLCLMWDDDGATVIREYGEYDTTDSDTPLHRDVEGLGWEHVRLLDEDEVKIIENIYSRKN